MQRHNRHLVLSRRYRVRRGQKIPLTAPSQDPTILQGPRSHSSRSRPSHPSHQPPRRPDTPRVGRRARAARVERVHGSGRGRTTVFGREPHHSTMGATGRGRVLVSSVLGVEPRPRHGAGKAAPGTSLAVELVPYSGERRWSRDGIGHAVGAYALSEASCPGLSRDLGATYTWARGPGRGRSSHTGDPPLLLSEVMHAKGGYRQQGTV